MRWTEGRMDAILAELIEENPLAVRPVLKILGWRFTDEVPTLAVTLRDPSELLINQGFIEAHCRTETHIKSVLMHEFMHVLLGHTMRFKETTEAQNMALDAVINAMITRLCGPEYGGFFSEFYADEVGFAAMLRPPTDDDRRQRGMLGADRTIPEELSCSLSVWEGLYEGLVVADDVLELAEAHVRQRILFVLSGGRLLIGNHDGFGAKIDPRLRRALEEALRQMSGEGIWRNPGEYGVGGKVYMPRVSAAQERMDRWKAQTMAALRKALVPGRSGLTELQESSYSLPVLSPRDRRAFLRAGWSAFIPDAENATHKMVPVGAANVYLDVSGSMHAEMRLIVGLLNQVRKCIRMPFWAFSTEVAPARIEQGELVTASTGGTSMACVLEHLARTRPPCAVVITDGYIEEVSRQLLERCGGIRITAIVTRDGNPQALHQAGIPYVQLEALPHG